MRRVLSLLSAVLFSAVCVQAQSLPSFEDAISQAGGQFLQARAEQFQAKNALLAGDIQRAAREADSLSMDTWRLRSQLSDVRRPAQQAQNTGSNQPQDPFLRSEIQRLVWDLRDYSRKADDIYRDIQRISRSVQQKDPELVQPAGALVSSTQRLSSEYGWVSSDARWVSQDIRRAGFSMEAWDVERESSSAENSTRQALYEAQRLLGQVR
jgi:hypothetical protein